MVGCGFFVTVTVGVMVLVGITVGTVLLHVGVKCSTFVLVGSFVCVTVCVGIATVAVGSGGGSSEITDQANTTNAIKKIM